MVGLLLFGIVLTSCTKEGPIGPEGPAGRDGNNGKDGNANVKTEIIKVFGYEWEYNDPIYSVSKTSDLLTKDIVDNGGVHLYLELGEGMWMALPYSTMGFGYAVDDLEIWTEGSSVTNQTTTYKLVVVAGNMQTRSKKVNFNNYEEVKKYYNLSE